MDMLSLNMRRVEGGHVRTEITSGNASLRQEWVFDAKGDLSSLSVQKVFEKRGQSPSEVKSEELVRGEDGKFKVVKSETSGIYSSQWDKEFNTVRRRTSSPRK